MATQFFLFSELTLFLDVKNVEFYVPTSFKHDILSIAGVKPKCLGLIKKQLHNFLMIFDKTNHSGLVWKDTYFILDRIERMP